MENNKLVGLVVMAAITLILTASVMIPILDDSEIKTKVYHENDGAIEYYSQASSVTMTGVAGGDDPQYVFSLSINGETVSPDPYTVIFASDSLWITLGGQMEIFAMDVKNNHFAAAGNGDTIDLSYSAGTYSAEIGTFTFTGSADDVFIWSPDKADYQMANSGTVNASASGIGYVGGILWGSKQGVIIFDDYTTSPTTYTLYSITDFNVTSSVESTIVWEVTDNDNSSYDISAFADSSNVTPVFTIIPTEYYTYEHNSMTEVLGIIPLMIIIAVLIAIVAAVIIRR